MSSPASHEPPSWTVVDDDDDDLDDLDELEGDVDTHNAEVTARLLQLWRGAAGSACRTAHRAPTHDRRAVAWEPDRSWRRAGTQLAGGDPVCRSAREAPTDDQPSDLPMPFTAEDPSYVLVIDDDTDLRDSLCEALEEYGIRTAAACNGVEALAYLRAHNAPAIIVLDLMMPIMDGRDFRAAQLADPSLDAIPVIVVTAQTDVRNAAAELHAAAFLTKPVRISPLVDLVRQHAVGNCN